MKILILTKRNFDEALMLQNHIRKALCVSTCDMFTENVNQGKIDLEYYDLIWMFYYPHIVKREILESTSSNWINTHPSYLPYNRGSAPNFFGITDSMINGATVHMVDGGLDTGDIIRQSCVLSTSEDTGEMLYNRLLKEALQLSIRTFNTHIVPWMNSGVIKTTPQTVDTTPNTMKMFRNMHNLHNTFDKDEIALIEYALDIIRAATFEGHEGAYFTNSMNEKIEIKVKLKVLEYDEN